MSRPLYRIGLLGASRIAPKAIIAPAARRPDCEVVAIACRSAERGRAYAREHGVERADVLDDYAAMGTRDDIDIVYNALPPSLHLATARACAGKVQLVEKPFAMNAAEAEAIAALPGVVMEAFHSLYHPAFAVFRKRVRDLGALSRIEASFHAAIPDRPGELRYIRALGGGALMDLGTYPLMFARQVAGREPSVVGARAACNPGGVDTALEAELDFGDGLSTRIRCDMRAGVERENVITVTGARGTVRFDNPVHPHRGFRISGPGGDVSEADHPRWTGLTTYDAQLAHLIMALSLGTPPLTGGAEAVRQMRAIDAIYAASGLGAR